MNTEQLNHLSLIKITGADAESFLQGQLTNDVQALKKNWHFSGYCSPKGRLLALLQIWRSGDVFFALLDQSLLETTLQRLRMYVMRSKVEIVHLDNVRLLGFSSQQELLSERPQHLIANDMQMYQTDRDGDTLLVCLGDRFLVAELKSSDKEMPHAIAPATNWLAADINEGIPRVNERSKELFIPQMLNLDVLDGISFRKGCYTGQEIVARMHYLGKLKQRMFVCEIVGDDAIESLKIGDKVFADSECTKSAGTIVASSSESNRALVVLRLDQADGSLYFDAETKLEVIEEQPYNLPQVSS